jgi:tetratricopeptide (TPR) repeat protein
MRPNPKLKGHLIELLEAGWDAEGRMVRRLSSDERRAAGAVDRWAAKDLLAHIGAWKAIQAERLASLRAGGSPRQFDSYDGINAELFHQHQHETLQQVLEFAARATDQLVGQTLSYKDRELGDADHFAAMQGRPVWQAVLGNGYSHPLGHLAQYYAGRGEVGLADELAEQVARRSLPLDPSPAWAGVVHYNAACHYALTGRPKRALPLLSLAFKDNPSLIGWSRQDEDLAALQGSPAFENLVAG